MAKKLSKSDKSIESFFGKGSCKGMSASAKSSGSATRERKQQRSTKRGK